MAKVTQSNEHTVSPSRAMKLLKALIKMRKPVFLHGAPGIGKSDMIRELALEMGYDVFDVRLLLMTEVDVRGIPYYSSDTKDMQWAPPSAFPVMRDGNTVRMIDGVERPAIIFLDEITQASPSVQAAALQLVLDRRIGEYLLHKNVAIVAAGNRALDRTGAKAVIKALANRFLHLNVEVSFDDWQKWALANNVHPEVVGYLSHKKEFLNRFDPSDPNDAFATPRSWVFFVSDILNSNDMDEELIRDAVIGSIGKETAYEFMEIRQLLHKLPRPSDIIEGKVSTLNKDGRGVAAQFSLVTSCTYHLRELHRTIDAGDLTLEKWYKFADNYMKFATDNMEPEIVVMGVTTAISAYKLPFNHMKMENYKGFFKKHEDLFKSLWST